VLPVREGESRRRVLSYDVIRVNLYRPGSETNKYVEKRPGSAEAGIFRDIEAEPGGPIRVCENQRIALRQHCRTSPARASVLD
jgi:hypothetical protein